EQPARGCGIGEIENVLGYSEALISENGVTSFINGEAEGEIRGQTSSDIWADFGSCVPGDKNGAIADIAIFRFTAMRDVVVLGESPDAMVVFIVGIAAADTDLMVESSGF